ncbi:thioredoxin family protein [Haliovirga abyssi]|uniref:Redox-active disulfide protein 2 n=1 Tax=Haliovirga abyssi TaxID=2996794 RepID=A0AAU9DX72_9FUSO|nr:thioredoxin family protein [Haliovirga abyssi]BDU49940.1 redox-active disulfide protein 2 [Haliovirga abyssi]
MNLKILGTGCPNCIKLEKNVIEAVEKLGIEAEIEKVTEIKDIMAFGVMMTPTLVVDGEVKIMGKIAKVDEIIKVLQK